MTHETLAIQCVRSRSRIKQIKKSFSRDMAQLHANFKADINQALWELDRLEGEILKAIYHHPYHKPADEAPDEPPSID